MAILEKEVTVEAPIEEVFGYISDPRNMPEFWPGLLEVKNVQPLPNGGYSAHWIYKMAGVRFEGTGKYIKMVPNKFFVIETKGGIPSTITWTFRSRDNITRVTLTIEYKLPVPLLRKLAETIIAKMNDHEGDLIMANLQARLTVDNH